MKKAHSADGKVLKEISRETQQLGKVTRFQLLDDKRRQGDYRLLKIPARKTKDDWSALSDVSSIKKRAHSGQGKVFACVSLIAKHRTAV